MAHVRKGKTAKRNRRLGALERLRLDYQFCDNETPSTYRDIAAAQVYRMQRIKAEIATLESRI